LYVARFDDDGTGCGIELTRISGYTGYRFADQADVPINARLAADAVGVAKMDCPEWCTTDPVTGEIYYTLTSVGQRRGRP
jgi:secreted PhoX family phosphatase